MSKKRKKKSQKPKNDVSLGVATMDDLPAIADMIYELHSKGLFDDPGKMNREMVGEFYKTLIEMGCIVIAKKNGKLAGMFAFSVMDWPFGKDCSVAQAFTWWVDPAYQGNGIGTKLLGEAERAGKTLGADFLVVTVRRELQSAAKTCVNHGYRLGESLYVKEI